MERHNRKCLNDNELGAYMEGRLSEIEKDSLEKRLFACRECWEDFVMMKQAIIHNDEEAENELPPHLMQRAVNMYPEKTSFIDIIVGIVKDSIQISHYAEGFQIFTPLPAGELRRGISGNPSMVVIKKSFHDIDVELDIEKTGSEICNIRIAVDEGMQKASVKPLRVELISNGRELVSTLLEQGETFLEDVGVGQYNIKIHKNGQIFGEIALKID
jgi:hypothetical protein